MRNESLILAEVGKKLSNAMGSRKKNGQVRLLFEQTCHDKMSQNGLHMALIRKMKRATLLRLGVEPEETWAAKCIHLLH